METFADASHKDVGMQTGIYVFVHGCCVDWRSVCQSVVAFNRAEAELHALAVGEAMSQATSVMLGSCQRFG